MMKRSYFSCFIAIAAFIAATGCSGSKKPPAGAAANIDPASLQLFSPLPESMPSATNPISAEKITLGRMLYYEPRLSMSQEIACNSCHMLDRYGVDGKPTSDGHKGQKGERNSPTVYNAAGNFVQFWDGRAADVEEQAKGPVMNPVEMAMPSEKQVALVLRSMPEYVVAFEQAFPGEKDPVNYANMAKAVGAFERKLSTPSRWDKFLKGDSTALTNEEKTGFNDFMAAGCQACHSGTYVGGNLYQKLGAVKPWPDASDIGRKKVTGSEADLLVFKVPGLRNIEKTGPYYHNGKVGSLDEAVTKMAEFQLGNNLSANKVQSIVIWLKALTGDVPAEYIKPPELPKSTGKTPKPARI